MLAKVGQNEEKVRFFSSERASEKNLMFGRNFWSRLTVAVLLVSCWCVGIGAAMILNILCRSCAPSSSSNL